VLQGIGQPRSGARVSRPLLLGVVFMGEGVDRRVLAEYPGGRRAGILASLTPAGAPDTAAGFGRKIECEGGPPSWACHQRSDRNYRGRLLHKLGIRDVPSLVEFAIRHGLTSAELGFCGDIAF